MKNIVICADDFGFNSVVNSGIIKLVELQKISAISCLVTAENFNLAAKKLQPFKNKIDIGLHFDLTENINPFGSFGVLILKAKLHLLSQSRIEKEFNKQLDLFLNAFEMLPDFIDGHQHIHQLPQICDAIFNVYEKRLKNCKPYLRYSHTKFKNVFKIILFKNLAINFITDLEFEAKLNKLSIPYNKSFAGIYSLDWSANYNLLFPKFLQLIEDKGLIMCHAGLVADNNKDPIAKNRFNEYQYFLSEQFTKDCAEADVVIGRFKK